MLSGGCLSLVLPLAYAIAANEQPVHACVREETIILMPNTARFVFLSATIPNAREFAEWIAKIHK